MKKFQKLSRAEMKNVLGGKFNGCPGGSCLLSGGCEISGAICSVGPDGVFGSYSGTCVPCTCPGQPQLQCYPN